MISKIFYQTRSWFISFRWTHISFTKKIAYLCMRVRLSVCVLVCICCLFMYLVACMTACMTIDFSSQPQQQQRASAKWWRLASSTFFYTVSTKRGWLQCFRWKSMWDKNKQMQDRWSTIPRCQLLVNRSSSLLPLFSTTLSLKIHFVLCFRMF